MGVSLRWVLLGARLWRMWEKDCRARDEAGIWSEEWGRVLAASVLSAALTGRKVHGMLWEATTEFGSHGVIAT